MLTGKSALVADAVCGAAGSAAQRAPVKASNERGARGWFMFVVLPRLIISGARSRFVIRAPAPPNRAANAALRSDAPGLRWFCPGRPALRQDCNARRHHR